jgi:hypothetical protein
MENRKFCQFIYALSILFGIHLIVSGVPVIDLAPQTDSGEEIIDDVNATALLNGTHKDLYVIKAVVYEIGILTEVNNSANASDEDYSHERVDLTFFDAHSNGSHYDLGDIPLPVQTNITGQVLTGIAPVHIGAIQDAADIFNTLPLTGTIVNISHSDTSYITLSHAPNMNENGTILDAEDLAKIPGLGSDAIQIDNTPQLVDEEDNHHDEHKTESSNVI